MDPGKEGWVTLSADGSSRLTSLQTARSSERLNMIDRVRAKGVGDHISLPQLAVCGDQSAGKSSVLEGITGIPFPRQDGLCTRFATEIILRHTPGMSQIMAKIIPSTVRTEDEKLCLKSYERQLLNFDELPAVIEEVSALMGIQGSFLEDGSGSATFAADVLRLEVVGNTGLHLTVVDLPGLIEVSENKDDVETVKRLVDEYLESSRTIVLAVVQANNDIDTQQIIQRARAFDKAGERTVGIITKPDLINKGTEARVATLAKNMERTKLRLGFFLLKNPSPLQLRSGMPWSDRIKLETDFFTSSPWKEQNLDQTRVGIVQLRHFLQDLLDDHIERELPKVRKEANALLVNTESELAKIGPERSSIGQVRMFLTQLGMKFYDLTKAAVEGNYDGGDALFFRSKDTARLRALVHRENEDFAAYMRDSAAKRKICHRDDRDITPSESTDSDQSQTTDS